MLRENYAANTTMNALVYLQWYWQT